MFSDLTLPFPDGPVWVAGALLVLIVSLAALLVCQRDRRASAPPVPAEAVPEPVPEVDAALHHPRTGHGSKEEAQPDPASPAALSDFELEPTRPRVAASAALPGPSAPAVEALKSVIAIFEQALTHSFTLEAAPGLESLPVDQPSFSLACAALLLHAAQGSFAHTIRVRPMTPGDALYPLALYPAVIVEIYSPPESEVRRDDLALRALDACDQAGGAGSIVDPSNLWLVWPTRQPVSLADAAARPGAALAHA